MTIRLHLLCAASTPAIRSASFPSNEPLDKEGRKALAAFTGSLPPFNKAWISPGLSAVQTAGGLAISATADARLRDCDFGRWAGLSLGAVHAAEPGVLAAWLSDPAAAPHGGESFADVMARVQAWMDGLLDGSGSVLAITHPSIIRAAIASALGASPSALSRIDVAPLTRARLSGACGRWTLSALLPFRAPDFKCGPRIG